MRDIRQTGGSSIELDDVVGACASGTCTKGWVDIAWRGPDPHRMLTRSSAIGCVDSFAPPAIQSEAVSQKGCGVRGWDAGPSVRWRPKEPSRVAQLRRCARCQVPSRNPAGDRTGR